MSKKPKKREKQIQLSFTDDIYKQALVIIIGGDWYKFLKDGFGCNEEFIGASKDMLDRPCEGIYFRVRPENNSTGMNCSVIWLKRLTIPELVHELIHFCDRVFRENYIFHSLEHDEAYAYYIAYWLTKIQKKVRLRSS